ARRAGRAPRPGGARGEHLPRPEPAGEPAAGVRRPGGRAGAGRRGPHGGPRQRPLPARLLPPPGRPLDADPLPGGPHPRRDPFHPVRRPPRQLVWIRAAGRLPDRLLLHQCVVAYASDMTLLDTATLPHAIAWNDPNYIMASLDHAMWFHRPFRADEWLLYAQ